MKFTFNPPSATAHSAAISEGRHIGTVIQIAGLGLQPAFNPGDPPVPSVGVVVQLKGAQLAKKMTLTNSQYGTLFSYVSATLPDLTASGDEDTLQQTLGCPVAIEVTTNGRFTNIASFHRPEDFELADAPTVAKADLVLLEGPEALTGDAGKALFLNLHSDIRSWLSKRIRS
jgi:hypothetical protein